MNPTDVYLYRIRNWWDGELSCDYLSHEDGVAEAEERWHNPDTGLETLVTIVTLPEDDA